MTRRPTVILAFQLAARDVRAAVSGKPGRGGRIACRAGWVPVLFICASGARHAKMSYGADSKFIS